MNEVAGRTRKATASVSLTSSTGAPLLPLLKPTFVNPPPPPSSTVSLTISARSPSTSPEHQKDGSPPPPVQMGNNQVVSKDESKPKEGKGPGRPRKNPPPPEKLLPVAVPNAPIHLKYSIAPKAIRRAEI